MYSDAFSIRSPLPRVAVVNPNFTAVGTSPPMPGAVVTMGAGAAAQAVAAASGVKELTSSLEADAGRLAGQIATTLQQFFATQGWTASPSDLPDLP